MLWIIEQGIYLVPTHRLCTHTYTHIYPPPPPHTHTQMYPNSIHITAVLVEYDTSMGRTNRGVTTSWLKKLMQQSSNGK